MVSKRSAARVAAQDFAPPAARHLVSWIAVVGIALTVSLSITDALQLAILTEPRGDVRAGLLAAALAIPFHVRHLIYGVRGERPPAGAWTLAALAIVTAGGAYFAGDAWLRELTLLAVSIVIVVPGRNAFVLAAAVALAPLVLVGTQWHAYDAPLGGVYLTFVIIWRSATQIVLLRLLAALRALDSANRELEARAVVQTRVRIDNELRNGVGAALQQIIARGESARAAVAVDPTSAMAELRQLVRDSRRGLADARRVVGRYRGSSLRAELDAAAALLEASGSKVRIVAADGMSLDSPDASSRAIIRTAIADALRAEPHTSYTMNVTRERDGVLLVRLVPDAAAVDGVPEQR